MNRLRSRLASIEKKADLNEKMLINYIEKSINYGLKFENGDISNDIKIFEIKSMGTIKDDRNTTTTLEIKIMY